jgi:hypothetical protein
VTELSLHGHEVRTVFDLLGDKENDITYSLGWALSHSDRLLYAVLGRVFRRKPGGVRAVRLQEFVPGGGFTDVEVETERVHLIVEAKRGWTLPRRAQLEQYAPRVRGVADSAIVVMSECSAEYARPRLPKKVRGVHVKHLSWAEVTKLAENAARTAGLNEKRLLGELTRYLRGLMTMQNTTSNMVYVVSLGRKDLFKSRISFADIVLKHNRYFHPMGDRGFPREPPNYLGFRFGGRLQQIRHVEDYSVHPSPWDLVAGLKGRPDWDHGPHFLYELGPAIVPPGEMKNGKLWPSARVWCALDLLLTCETVAEARDKTNERLAATGQGRLSGT